MASKKGEPKKRACPIAVVLWSVVASLIAANVYLFTQETLPEAMAASETRVAASSAAIMADDINDDGQGTAYIKVSNALSKGPDAAIAEIMVKKQQWKKQSLGRRIVSVSIVSGSDKKLYEQNFIAGLLIHYE